jgi:hypothetical protein
MFIKQQGICAGVHGHGDLARRVQRRQRAWPDSYFFKTLT